VDVFFLKHGVGLCCSRWEGSRSCKMCYKPVLQVTWAKSRSSAAHIHVLTNVVDVAQ